jgi:hypothetical protein
VKECFFLNEEEPTLSIHTKKNCECILQSLDYILILMNGFMVNYMVSCVNSLLARNDEEEGKTLAKEGLK